MKHLVKRRGFIKLGIATLTTPLLGPFLDPGSEQSFPAPIPHKQHININRERQCVITTMIHPTRIRCGRMTVKGFRVCQMHKAELERRCAARKKSGVQCEHYAIRGYPVCGKHGAGSPYRKWQTRQPKCKLPLQTLP